MNFERIIENSITLSAITHFESMKIIFRSLDYCYPFLLSKLPKKMTHAAFDFLLFTSFIDLFAFFSLSTSALPCCLYLYPFKTVTYIYLINGTEEK